MKHPRDRREGDCPRHDESNGTPPPVRRMMTYRCFNPSCDWQDKSDGNWKPEECPDCGSPDVRLVESESDRKPRKEKGSG